MDQLFDLIVKHVPPPVADPAGPFAMLATTLEADNFVGRILTGRIHSGVAKLNMPVKVLRRDGKVVAGGRLTKMLSFQGLKRVPIEEAAAGDIVALAGLADAHASDTKIRAAARRDRGWHYVKIYGVAR